MTLLGCDLHYVSVGERMAQRYHLPIHFRSHTPVANVSVTAVGKVYRSGSAGQRQHFALRRKDVNLLWIEIHLARGKKLPGLAPSASPFGQLSHPHHASIGCRTIRATLVPTVR